MGIGDTKAQLGCHAQNCKIQHLWDLSTQPLEMSKLFKSVLITGVSGFIGRYVARHFFNLGWSVIGVDNSSEENAPTFSLTRYENFQLPDSKLDSLLQETLPQVLIHCAGRASVNLSIEDPYADFHANTVLTFELLNSLRLYAPTCRFVFLSSAAVYGNPDVLPITENYPCNPISPYGFHKLQSEQLCLEFNRVFHLQTASVRIFSAYGPGLRRQVLWDICRKAMTESSLELLGTGQESRDFIHSSDIARALAFVAESAPFEGEAYNLASGQETSIEELTHLILKNLDMNPIVRFSGIAAHGNPLNWQADISRLKALGYVPSIPLERGIKTFVDWCRAEFSK